MAGAEAVSPELDDENTKNNETADSAVHAEICEEEADSEHGTAGLPEPEVTLNEEESSGNTNVNPPESVQCESDSVCSPCEFPSEPNVNITPVQPTTTDCENTSSNCAAVLETVPSESGPSELSGDPSINVFPATDNVSKIRPDSEGSSAVDNCIENITADGAEGIAEGFSDAFSAVTETCNVNGTDSQGSGSTRDINVSTAEFLSTDSNFRQRKNKCSEAFEVNNTKIPVTAVNNASELVCHEELQHDINPEIRGDVQNEPSVREEELQQNSNPESRDDVQNESSVTEEELQHNSNPESRDDLQNEPSVTEEGKQIDTNSDTNIGSEKSETKLLNFDSEADKINVQNCETENNSTQVCASNEESALNFVNIIESTRDTNSQDSTSTNDSSDTRNTLWHKKNVLNSHYYSEQVNQYCTNSTETIGSANVLESLKPCSVILERLDTNVIAALKNIDNSSSCSFELNIDKSNQRTVVSPVKDENLTFDPADSDRFTSQNPSGEYIMKENKVKPQPRTQRTARTRKRKRRRTISSSSSGVLTGSESDRTICNDENKSATHSESEISRQEMERSKQEPDQKKLKTIEEESLDVEDSDVNPASSASNPILNNRKASTFKVKDLKEISSVGMTCGQDDSSDYSVVPPEDPLILDNKQMTDQENSEDSNRKDDMETGQIQMSSSISLCQSNHTTLPEDISTLGSDLRQENQEITVRNIEGTDLERTCEDMGTNEKGGQSGECVSHENGIDTEDRLNLTVDNGDVSNRTKSDALNGTSTSESKDPGDCGNDEMLSKPNNFEESTKENSVTSQKLGDATCIIPDEPRVAPIEETSEVQKPETGYLSTPFDVNVADKSFTDAPGRQLQKSNRGRKPLSWKSNKQPEQKSTRPQRQAARKAETQIKVLAEQDSKFQEELEQQVSEDTAQMCFQCCRMCVCEHQVMVNGVSQNICSEECINAFKAKEVDKVNTERSPAVAYHQRKCRQCQNVIAAAANHLAWETMDFCQEECLAKFQKDLGGFCCYCKGPVPSNSLGKYCVRFGFDIRQFCRSTCLEEFKKGLKVCSYCQKDISGGSEGFLAPVGDRGQFKEFCSQHCMEKYDFMSGNKQPPPIVHQCAVCNNEKLVTIEVMLNGVYNKLCSEPCFAAFKFVNRIIADQCNVCRKYFDLSNADNYVAYYDDVPRRFCCRTCMNVFILANRRIVPCNWCKVKKYNFDMIKRVTGRGVHLLMCSLNCLALYLYSVNAIPTKRLLCDMCSVFTRMQFHLAMSDSSVRNFCSYGCVTKFQDQFKNASGEALVAGTPTPTGAPMKAVNHRSSTSTPANDIASTKSAMPVISSVTSLAHAGLPTGSGVESSGSEPTALAPVTTRESSSVIVSPSVESVTKTQVSTPVSSESVTTKVSAVLSDLATKHPVPISLPVPVSEFVSPEINKTDPTKQATSSPQVLPVVLDKFAETTASAVLPVAAAASTATTNSTVSAAGAPSLAVISNAFLGTTSPVDAVLPDSGDGPDVSVGAQKTPSISMVPEKFLAKPSTVGEIFSVETAVALATGVSTDASTKAATQQSTAQPWRITEEFPEKPSASLPGTTSSGMGTTATGGSGKSVPSAESDGTVMRVLVKEVVCIEPEEPPEMKNACVLAKPILHSKAISCRPQLHSRLSQTDMSVTKLPFVPIPIPVPIFVPCPMHMFTSLFPVPMPFPLPIPVPTLIPTTKNTFEELMKEIKNIKEKVPENPAEAELLTMAEMVASEGHKELDGDKHSDDDEITEIAEGDESAAVPEEESNHVAQKEFEIPAKTPITRKRTRKSSVTLPEPGEFIAPLKPKSGSPGKPDAHLMLKYTLCLRAWHFWVKDKNKDLEIAAGANYKPRFIKPDILELTAEELNYALCLFVTEAKKPSGIEYAPDVLFYFCLGIQYYLYECGRVDNIFTDPYYIKFTDCLDKIVQSFMAKQMASDEIATRVMEEHLWESKQLGAHSPDVLLTTLMFFNTKYFNLVTADDHMQLSFANIIKHWKRPGQAAGGTTCALLRFYPPQSVKDGKAKNKKKKKYEQHENEENPLRCPVKLYEFYLSKCPDSVKARSDLFYLQPERSCVPDSPVWYTSSPLRKDLLAKMLNRLKIVKEINEAIYCS